MEQLSLYDLNGNVLYDGLRNFAYDDENQLTSVLVSNAWRSQFVYDGKMRRRIRKEFTWQSGAWVQTNEVHYIYDGNLVVQERDINNLPVTTYTRGNDLSGSLQGAGGIGGMLAMSQPSTVNPQHYYYHADGNGNITAMVNAQQIIVAKYLYDPFGNTIALAGPMAALNHYRFSSKEYDQNSGLIYFLFRFYDPNFQRWLNRDPFLELGFEAFRTAGIVQFSGVPGYQEEGESPNLFEGIGNDGNDFIDTDGLGLWQSTKTIAGQVGNACKNTWKASCTAASATLAALSGITAWQKVNTNKHGWWVYHNTEAALNKRFGDEENWPQWAELYMAQRRKALINQFGDASGSCAQAIPGIPSASGPVDNPIR